jgi:hypothetical protein
LRSSKMIRSIIRLDGFLISITRSNWSSLIKIIRKSHKLHGRSAIPILMSSILAQLTSKMNWKPFAHPILHSYSINSLSYTKSKQILRNLKKSNRRHPLKSYNSADFEWCTQSP